MMESEKDGEEFDMSKTFLVQIKPEQSNLPIDVASTWTQGFLYINKILEKIDKDTHIEDYVDNTGIVRRKTVIHPLLLPMLQERRKLLDQVWKISGGELMNEARKTVVKNFAKQLFEAQISKEKQEYEQKFKEIIETEADDNE